MLLTHLLVLFAANVSAVDAMVASASPKQLMTLYLASVRRIERYFMSSTLFSVKLRYRSCVYGAEF